MTVIMLLIFVQRIQQLWFHRYIIKNIESNLKLRRKLKSQNNEMFERFLDLFATGFIVFPSRSYPFWFEPVSYSAQIRRAIVP